MINASISFFRNEEQVEVKKYLSSWKGLKIKGTEFPKIYLLLFGGVKMFKKNGLLMLTAVMLIAGLMLAGCSPKDVAEPEEWNPDRPIKVVVPFAAGGAIDRTSRALQPHLEQYLGVSIAVTNYKETISAYDEVFNSPKDGYTVLCISPEIATMAVMGRGDMTVDDWIPIGFTTAFANIFVVHPDSPIKDLNDLIDALAENGLTCGHAAYGGAWQQGVMLFTGLAGIPNPEFVPQGGGFLAAQAAMKKEVDFAACGIPEVMELLPAGKLRALAYWGSEPYYMEGYGEIPPITDYLPEASAFTPWGGWTGFAVPKGTPEHIVKKLKEAYAYAVQQESFLEFCQENAFIPQLLIGEDFEQYIRRYAAVAAWNLYDAGYAAKSPEEFGIERDPLLKRD
jgi:tripartite-type tricarboxylate transporter receptor subunit TctC